MHCYRTLGSMLGLLLVSCHDRAMRCREAMLLRGFDGRLPMLHPLRFGRADLFFCLALSMCLSALCWLEWGLK